jgi:hypothetical protein
LKGPIAAVALILIGLVLSASSSLSLPLGFGVAEFWLGVAVEVAGCLWFGAWGVLACAVFPLLSSLLIGLDLSHSLAVFPANMAQGLIPAVAFRLTGADPALHDARSTRIYALWAVILPSLLGGLIAAGALILLDQSDWSNLAVLGFDWAVSNGLVLVVVGFPLLYLLTPILRERGWLISGWWY